jgi:hypothetical protein
LALSANLLRAFLGYSKGGTERLMILEWLISEQIF